MGSSNRKHKFRNFFPIFSAFIRQLQNINNIELNNTPPDTEKFKPTVKSLKNSKIANDVPFTYVKHVMNDKELDG